MAITVVTQPAIFAPSENLCTWKVTSNLSNLVYFAVTVTIDNTSTILGNFKYYPRPDFLGGCIIEISQLLNSVLANPFNPLPITTPTAFVTANIAPIQLNIIEMVNVSGVIQSAGAVTTTGRRIFWKGLLNPFEIQNAGSFYTNNNNSGKFLTKNKVQRITSDFDGTLSVLMNENVPVGVGSDLRVEIFNQEPDGSWSNYYGINLPSYTSGMPIRYCRFHVVNTSVDFVRQGAMIDNYKMVLYRGATELDSVTYIIDDKCGEESFIVFFLNSYGAWESVSLKNPVFENDYARTNITMGQTRLNADGSYNDYKISNGKTIYNANTKVINTNITSKLTGNTFDLRDDELLWIEDIFQSEYIYLKYKGVYLPATLDTKKHSLKPKRKNGGVNFLQLTFNIQDIM